MKALLDYFRWGARALSRRASQALIAVAALATGTAVLCSLTALYFSVPQQLGREFRSYGANLVLLPAGERDFLEDKDLSGLPIPQEKVVGMASFLYAGIQVNGHGLTIAGTDLARAFLVSPYWRLEGLWPAAGQVLLGAQTSEILALRPGQTLTIRDPRTKDAREVTVSGILRTGGPEESLVFADRRWVESWLQIQGRFNLVQLSVMAGAQELAALAREIEARSPGIEARPVKQLAASETAVLGKLQALVFVVTAVVVLLTLICVGTTMVAVIAERRGEIGLKKALGARNGHIVAEFVGEALGLGVLGGVAGALAGTFLSDAVSLGVFGRPAGFQPWLFAIALGTALGLSALSSLIPVRMALSVQPIVVLRGE